MYILFIFKYILFKCDTLCLLYLTSKEQMIFNFLIEIFFLYLSDVYNFQFITNHSKSNYLK